MKLWYVLERSALLALVAPVIWFAMYSVYDPLPMWALRPLLVFWPSAVYMMATAGIEGSAKAYGIAVVAVALNVLMYTVIGGAIWCISTLGGYANRRRNKGRPA
jgi:hypothetical protein